MNWLTVVVYAGVPGGVVPVNQKEQGRAEIAEILSRRISQYTHAVVKAALALDSRNDQWKNCVTSVQLSDGEPVQSRCLLYPGFEIHVAAQSPEEILRLVEHLVTEGKFHIANRVILLKDGRFDRLGYKQEGRRVSSGEAWIPSEWPGDQYLFAASREINPPSESLVGSGVPAYPDGFAAIEHVLGMDARGGRTWDGGVCFFFPDYRARIDSVTLGIESLSIEISLRKSELSDLVGKVYAKSQERIVQQRDVEFHTPQERVDLGFQPQHIYVGLLCKSDDQILDQWEYSPFRRSSKPRVELFTPQYTQQLIEQGEDDHVEYKPGTKDDKAKREIAESAIAFSNKNGGVILVGIDDNARIDGAFGDGWEDSITQSLRDRCEPPVEATVRRVVLEDKPVYVVLVPESDNKPHLLRGTGVVYIRVASTDKPATRYELEELFDRNQHLKRP